MKKKPIIRINIGCGQTPTLGWLNFDNSLSLYLSRIPLLPTILLKLGLLETPQYQFMQYARANNIEFGDAIKGLPITTGAIDVLYSCHMLEHLSRNEVDVFLKEARRLLRPGGVIRIVVPDLNRLTKQYIASCDADTFIESTRLCGSPSKTLVRRLHFLLVGSRHHQWMYDGASLRGLLKKHGFVQVKVLAAGETTIDNPQPLDLHERSSESVYVEAENPNAMVKG